ncbi:MAG: hypothetical protein ACPL7A_03725, partial [Anaerolineales bacterium]
FKLILGDHLPAAKFLFSLYYLSLILFLDSCLRNAGITQPSRGVINLVVANTPLIFRHASLAYANLPFTFYLFSGSVLLWESITSLPSQVAQAERSSSSKTVWLALLLLCGAAWTRPEGLALIWLLIGGLIVGVKIKNISLSFPFWAAIGVPLMVYMLFWWLIKLQAYPQPLKDATIVSLAFNQITHGNFHFSQGFYLSAQWLARILQWDIWGASGFGLWLLGLIALVNRKHIFHGSFPYLFSGLIFTLAMIGIYYIFSFDSKHDLSWWLNTGFDRMNLPGWLFFYYGLILAFFHPQRNQGASD